jgi:hypothetical protein
VPDVVVISHETCHSMHVERSRNTEIIVPWATETPLIRFAAEPADYPGKGMADRTLWSARKAEFKSPTS